MKTPVALAALVVAGLVGGCATTDGPQTASVRAPRPDTPPAAAPVQAAMADGAPGGRAERIKAFWQKRCPERHTEFQAKGGQAPEGAASAEKVHEDEMCRRLYEGKL